MTNLRACLRIASHFRMSGNQALKKQQNLFSELLKDPR